MLKSALHKTQGCVTSNYSFPFLRNLTREKNKTKSTVGQIRFGNNLFGKKVGGKVLRKYGILLPLFNKNQSKVDNVLNQGIFEAVKIASEVESKKSE